MQPGEGGTVNPPNRYIPQDLWDEIVDFITDQVDVVDGTDGLRPNKAMQLVRRIDTEVS